jgi:hypothetical protein
MAQQIEGIDEIFNINFFRHTGEGVELDSSLCEKAGLAIPVFMSKELYGEHQPEERTMHYQVTSRERNLLSSLTALRWLSATWTDIAEPMESVIPSGGGVKSLEIAAMLVPASEPFIILSKMEEVEDLMGERNEKMQ